MPSRVLVTGGGGLVGAWTVRALGERAVAPPRASLDVRSLPEVERALAGCSAVLHFAGQSVVGEAERDPVATFEANVAGTWTVLEACRRAGARVLVASSHRVYGPVAGAVTEAAPLAPADRYGASKAAAEVVAAAFAPEVRVAVTRMSNVYGGGDRQTSRLVPEIVAAAREGRPARIRSDGSPRHDLLHASDAAAAHLALLDALEDPAVAGQAFNVGAGEAHAVSELVDLARELAPGAVAADYSGGSGGEPAWLDTAKLRELTGWTPRTALRDGIAEALRA